MSFDTDPRLEDRSAEDETASPATAEPDKIRLLNNPMPRVKRIADASAGDFFPTAPYCVLALLAVEAFTGDIGEFACGQGHIAETLKHSLPNRVLASDKFDRGYGTAGIPIENILDAKGRGAVDNIITNPPYARGIIDPFIETAVALTRRKCALLMGLRALEGGSRYSLYERIPPARVWVFSTRPTFWANRVIHYGDMIDKKPAKGGTAYAWYVWDRDHVGDPAVKFLGPDLTASLQERSRQLTALIENKNTPAA